MIKIAVIVVAFILIVVLRLKRRKNIYKQYRYNLLDIIIINPIDDFIENIKLAKSSVYKYVMWFVLIVMLGGCIYFLCK